MTAIANYWAELGFRVDPNSIPKVDSFLDKIESRINKFNSSLGKTKAINLRINEVSISRTAMRSALTVASAGMKLRVGEVSVSGVRIPKTHVRRAMNAAVNGGANAQGAIRLSNFIVSQKTLKVAIDNALMNARFRLHGVSIARESLTAMRQQVRAAIDGMVIRPVLRPEVRQATARGRFSNAAAAGAVGGAVAGASGRRYDRLKTHRPDTGNPYYNPAMLGGFSGAAVRYGFAALPLISGAMGLNALVNKTAVLESQDLMLRTALQDENLVTPQRDYVNNLGERLGVKSSTIMPFYAQMYAGARGTALEEQLPGGFSNFMDYASVMGLNDEQMKGSIRAISQMISKGKVQSEELRQQLA